MLTFLFGLIDRPQSESHECPYMCKETNKRTNFQLDNNRIQRRKSTFFTVSSLRREPSSTRTLMWPRRDRVQITCNTSSAYHVQHVVLIATLYEGTAQPLSVTEFKSHLFELYFIADPLTDEGFRLELFTHCVLTIDHIVKDQLTLITR